GLTASFTRHMRRSAGGARTTVTRWLVPTGRFTVTGKTNGTAIRPRSAPMSSTSWWRTGLRPPNKSLQRTAAAVSFCGGSRHHGPPRPVGLGVSQLFVGVRVIREGSGDVLVPAICEAGRALVFISVPWSAPERRAREAFRAAATHLAQECPEL